MFFSVIIPAYNRERELPRSIESVLSQTHRDFELVIVDNGSTDRTREVVQSYIAKDNRVRYFWQENSGSPAGSRNTGIRNAQYEWVAFLDSDDYWFPQKLEEVNKVIEQQPQIVAVSHYEEQVVSGVFDKILKHGHGVGRPLYESLLFKGNAFSTSAMTVRKKELLAVGLFDTRRDYFAVEDYDMWMKLSQKGEFYCIHKVLGVFSIADGNMSRNIELINNNLKTLVLDHIERYPTENKNDLKRIHGARVDYYKGRSYQLAGEYGKAIPILLSSISRDPWKFKKVASLVFALLRIRK
ncbi:MAG TPA: glycosyltransferase family A protein [Bdellovibrio sp.]|uniref:glycosyltransferase family 2 protein n=1 Tax=Bdellovibrio sp. TaxID=28201 RepID=UPI002EF08CD2